MGYVGLIIAVAAPPPVTYRGRRFTFPAVHLDGDVQWYEHLLRTSMPEGSPLIVRTRPAETTGEAIRSALKSAVRDLDAGDTFVLVVVGHGFQVPDVDGDEEDGVNVDRMDEALATSDGLILDDWFRWLWTDVDPGVDVVLIADTCSADTVLVRYMTPAPDAVVSHASRGPARLAISASREWEKADEVTRVGGQTMGAMSSALRDAWGEGPQRPGSYQQWFMAAARSIATDRGDQQPRLRYLGPADRADLMDRPPFS